MLSPILEATGESDAEPFERVMRLYDQHLHSRHSFDSSADPQANVESALARGLAGLTFTEHFDTHPNEWNDCIYDHEAYSATIHRLREIYGKRLFIGKGIEVCYQPQRMDFILDFLSRHEFDMVTLSVHYFGEVPVHKKEHWEGVELHTGTRRYLEKVRDAVRHCAELRAQRGRVFDVLGHMDMVKRYTQRFFGSHDVGPCADLFDDILRGCLAADLIPEINTSSLRQGLDESMPGPATVRRYAELGGTCISLGSDSHRSEHIGAGFDYALGILRAAGIKHTAWFDNRERTAVAVDE